MVILNDWYVWGVMSDTKDDILEAATKLFLQRSYDAVSIKDITEAMGVTKGALYHHFSSKEELLGEVIGREFQAYQIDFERLPKQSFHAFYRAVYKEMWHFILEPAVKPDGNDCGLQFNHFRLIWDAMQVLDGFSKSVGVSFVCEQNAWSDVVSQAVANGELRSELESDRVAELFISASTGCWLRCLMRGQAAEIPKAVLSSWDDLYVLLKA